MHEPIFVPATACWTADEEVAFGPAEVSVGHVFSDGKTLSVLLTIHRERVAEAEVRFSVAAAEVLVEKVLGVIRSAPSPLA